MHAGNLSACSEISNEAASHHGFLIRTHEGQSCQISEQGQSASP